MTSLQNKTSRSARSLLEMPFHTRGSHQRQPLVQAQVGNKKNKASSPKSVRQLELTDLANSWSSLLAHEQRRYQERAGPLSAQRLAPRRHVLHPVSMRAGTLARPSGSTLPTPKPQLLQCPPHLRQSFQRARPPRHLHVGSDGQDDLESRVAAQSQCSQRALVTRWVEEATPTSRCQFSRLPEHVPKSAFKPVRSAKRSAMSSRP